MKTKYMRSGIDYLTATIKPTEDGHNVFYAMAKAVSTMSDFVECETRNWSFYGYKGFILTAGNSGHFAYGDHYRNGHIVQMSGEYAIRYWLQFVNVADNISRIDFMTDAELHDPDPNLAKRAYDLAVEHDWAKDRKYTLVMGIGTGQTLYIGSRKSSMFGRLYDKSAEANLSKLGSVWRYEIEFKGKPALVAANRIATNANEGVLEDIYPVLAATVYEWFDARNIEPIFDHDGQAVTKFTAGLEDEKLGKVMWLRQQVSPTVRRLIMSGRHVEVIDALGLNDFFEIRELGMRRNGTKDTTFDG